MKSKQSAFTKSRKKKVAKRTIIQTRPKHLLLPKGRILGWRSSTNLVLKTTGFGKVSFSAIKAFKKALMSKKLRKRVIFRASPYLDLTKKPNEVRMGKGHGTKIQDTIFPFSPGQILLEVNLKRRLRLLRSSKFALLKAAHKFRFPVKVLQMDI